MSCEVRPVLKYTAAGQFVKSATPAARDRIQSRVGECVHSLDAKSDPSVIASWEMSSLTTADATSHSAKTLIATRDRCHTEPEESEISITRRRKTGERILKSNGIASPTKSRAPIKTVT